MSKTAQTSAACDYPSPPGPSPIPLELLVQEVYAASPPEAQEHILAQLVGKVYESSPVSLQTRLLEQLLRPVGVLSLIAIANGIFAKIRFRAGWPDTSLRSVDVQSVRPADVVALVEHALQGSGAALNGLTHMLTTSPSLSGSGAAAVLLALLMQRTQHRRADDPIVVDTSAPP